MVGDSREAIGAGEQKEICSFWEWGVCGIEAVPKCAGCPGVSRYDVFRGV